MWQDKKFIIIVALLIVAIAVGGTLGGIALTRSNNNNADRAQSITEMIDKAANLFQANSNTANIMQGLEKDFGQAGQALKSDAVDSYLKKLVEDGKITQEQADQFKAWLDARPDMPAMNGQTEQPGMRFFGMMHGGRGSFGFGGGSK
ncbi:MAG: DUF2680 domain-containing protein [Dehalococcoidales bacterium]